MEIVAFFFSSTKKQKKKMQAYTYTHKAPNSSDEVSIQHQHGCGVIPYLMAVSEGERQRGG